MRTNLILAFLIKHAVVPGHIHTNTHTHTAIYRPKYILKCVHGFNSLGPIFIQKFVFLFGTSSLQTPMGSGVEGDISPMLFPKSICVCILCFKSVAPRVCMPKVQFLAFLGD